jgi:hypothetical protein
MTNLYDKLVGIPWYRPERYDDARGRMADADSLPISYDVWREGAEQRENDIRRSGSSTERVNVDDDIFVTFCAERNLMLNSKFRMAFVGDRVAHGTKANVTDYENPFFRHGAKRRK